jgi:hypothetical protein
MPTRTLKQLKAAMPTGMEMEELMAILPEIFAAARCGAEEPFDVATVFLEAIGRAAENYQRVSPETEQSMLTWVKANWTTSPADFFKKLCAILVNLKTDEAHVFLEEQQAAATEAAVKAHLAYCLRNRKPANPVG